MTKKKLKKIKIQDIPWIKLANNAMHVLLLLGSAYIVANPEAVWLVPFLQAMGQGMHSPK